MKIHKVTNIEQFVAKIIPKQAQKNKSIVESILKNVQKNGDSSRTISNKPIYLTGLKKWVIQKSFLSSMDIFADKTFKGIVDVFDEIIESGFLALKIFS